MFHIFKLVRNPSQRTFKRIPIWWHHEASQCFGTNFGHEIIEIECLKAQIINFVKWAMLKQSSKSYSKYSKHKTIAKTLQTIHKRFANAWRHEATLWHRHLLLNYRYQVTKKITKLNFFKKELCWENSAEFNSDLWFVWIWMIKVWCWEKGYRPQKLLSLELSQLYNDKVNLQVSNKKEPRKNFSPNKILKKDLFIIHEDSRLTLLFMGLDIEMIQLNWPFLTMNYPPPPRLHRRIN